MPFFALDRYSSRPTLPGRTLPLLLAVAGHALLVLLLWPRSEQAQPLKPANTLISVSLIEPRAPATPPAQTEEKTAALAPASHVPPPQPPKTVEKKQPTPLPRPVPAKVPAATEEPAPIASSASEAVASHSIPARSTPQDAVLEPPLIEARHDADYLNNPAPPYPPLSRRLGEEGRVVVRALVGTDGQPQTVEVHISSGSERLDKAALDAVRQWRFIPARRGDAPVTSTVLIPFSFTLER